MNRRKRIERRTPLQPGVPLRRKAPLRQVSLKRATADLRGPGQKDTGPDPVTRSQVLGRDHGCVVCGKGPYGLQVHHRKPRRMGGRSDAAINSPANLVSVCGDDHAWLEANRREALDMGLLLHEREDPEQIPVLHHTFGAVYLLADGSIRPVPLAGKEPVWPVLASVAVACAGGLAIALWKGWW